MSTHRKASQDTPLWAYIVLGIAATALYLVALVAYTMWAIGA